MFDFNTETGEIFLYDDIGPAWAGMIDEGAITDAIKAIGNKRIHLRINSQGGSVDIATGIFNMLGRHSAGVDTYVDGIAASAGHHLMQAGEKRTIAKNAKIMVHDPWSIAMGNSASLRKTADVLDLYRDTMITDLATRSKISAKEIREIMAAETWYNAKDAVAAGWADEIGNTSKVKVEVPEGKFQHTPEDILVKPVVGSWSTKIAEAKLRLTRLRR